MSEIDLQINDRKYEAVLMPPLRAIEFAPRVVNFLTNGAANGDVGGLLRDFANGDASLFSKLVMLVAGFDSEKFNDLAKEVISTSSARLNGQGITTQGKLDEWIKDNKRDYFPVVCWLIWENVKDFLLESRDGFLAVFGGQSLFQSPKEESGTS